MKTTIEKEFQHGDYTITLKYINNEFESVSIRNTDLFYDHIGSFDKEELEYLDTLIPLILNKI